MKRRAASNEDKEDPRWPLIELAGVVGAVAREVGMPSHLADILAKRIVEGYVATLGGESPYIPKRCPWTLVERDARIKQEFDGSNAEQLGRRYDLHPRRIRQIAAPSKRSA